MHYNEVPEPTERFTYPALHGGPDEPTDAFKPWALGGAREGTPIHYLEEIHPFTTKGHIIYPVANFL